VKEIKVVIQQLRNYPNNLFVYPALNNNQFGLVICDLKGKQIDFVKTGSNNGEVVVD